MSRKFIYLLVALAFIFFLISLLVFFQSKSSSKDEQDSEIIEETVQQEPNQAETVSVKLFFFVNNSSYMRPVATEFERSEIPHDNYRKLINLLLIGKKDYISPIPEGLQLRTLYFLKKKGMLILDFSEELGSSFPGGSRGELEFIYFFVDNLCYNFKEIKKVKFMIAGNEYRTISGHIDIEYPFYPNFRYLRDQ